MYTSNLMSILDSDADLDLDTKKFVLSYAGDNATQVKRKMQARTFVAINTALEVCVCVCVCVCCCCSERLCRSRRPHRARLLSMR